MESFWACEEAFLAVDQQDDRFFAELDDEDALQALWDIPSLSLDASAQAYYDQRLEESMKFWPRDAGSPTLPRPFSNLRKPAAAIQIFEGNNNESCSEDKAVSEADTSHKGERKAKDDILDEDNAGEVGGKIPDEDDVSEAGDDILNADDISEVGDGDLDEDYDSIGADNVSEDADTVDLEWKAASHCNATSDIQHHTNASTLITFSCRACRSPDHEQMIACNNDELHYDDEAWYHFQCVGLSPNNVPEGDWYCPQCHSEMQEAADPSSLSARDRRTSKTPTKRKANRNLTKSKLLNTKSTTDLSEHKSRAKKDTESSKKQKKEKSSQAVKEPDKPKKTSKPWSDPTEKQKVLELLMEYQKDETVEREIRYSEKKWEVVSARLLELYNFDRSRNAIKLKFGRTLRALANYDERDETHKNPNKMQTSVESPEARKKKRQANLSGRASVSPKRERGSNEEDDEDEGNPAKEKGEPSAPQKKRRRRNSEEGGFSEEDLPGECKQSYAQEYDVSAHKNKGKHKRDEEDE